MIEHLKHLGLFVLHSMTMTIHQVLGFLVSMFPEKPPQPKIDIEDDHNEVEDDPYEVHDNIYMGNKEIKRNEWGLPSLEEEE